MTTKSPNHAALGQGRWGVELHATADRRLASLALRPLSVALGRQVVILTIIQVMG
jgi:hypothetical protein